MFGIDDFVVGLVKELFKYRDPLVKEIYKWTDHYQNRDPNFGKPEIKHNTFYISLDFRFFKPEDINIILNNGMIKVNCKREVQSGDSYIFRHYIHKFKVPENVDHEKLTCSVDKTGILQCHAPLFKIINKDGSRTIPVERKK